MTKQIISQNSFTAGELSPKIYSQTNSEEFKKGLETATNCHVTPYGPVQRRNGTTYVGAVKTQANSSRFISYEVDNDTKFMLEFGDSYIRFYTAGAQITEGDVTISGLTAANPGVVTATAHGFSNGDHVYITEVVGMTEVNNPNTPYIVANKATNTFELTDLDGTNVDTSGYTTYSSAGVANRIYTITSPYDITEVDDITYVQNGADLYLAHPSYQPRVLVRNGSTDWSITTLNTLPGPTTEAGRAGAQTLTLGATTGTSISATAGAAFFQQSDVGRQIISLVDNGIATITSYTSTTVVTVNITEDFGTTSYTASSEWKVNKSPVSSLEFNGTGVVGSTITVYSGYRIGYPTSSALNIIGGYAASDPTSITLASHGYAAGNSVIISGMEASVGGPPDDVYRVKTVTSANDFTLYTAFFNEDVDGRFASGTVSGSTVQLTSERQPINTFETADIGKYIYVHGGILKIISRTNAYTVVASVISSLDATSRTSNWTLEEEQWSSTNGYPKAIEIHQNRLWFAGSTLYPLRVWASKVGDFINFNANTVNDGDGIDIEISSEKGAISWIHSQRELLVGTIGEEIAINGGTATAAITPTNISAKPRSSYGSNTQKPITVGNSVLFIENSKRRIRSLLYDFSIDSYRSKDLNFLAEHLTEGNIAEIAYSKSPETLLRAITEDGKLLVAAYDAENSVLAWSKYTTNGTFERILSINKTTGDEVWTLVKRTIDGNTRRYIELLPAGNGTNDTDSFSDCSQTYSTGLTITGITAADPAVVTSASHGLSNGNEIIIKGLVDPNEGDLNSSLTNMSSLNQKSFLVANVTTNTFELTNMSGNDIDASAYNAYGSGGTAYLKVTSLTGLDYLEGKTVQVKGDGAVQVTKIVSGGAITAATSAGEFVVGLPYTTTIKTLNHEFSSGLGSMQGQRARWVNPLVRVYRSSKPTLNGEYIPSRASTDLINQKVPLYSGILEYGPLKWADTTALTITTSDPLPLMITGITGAIDSGVK